MEAGSSVPAHAGFAGPAHGTGLCNHDYPVMAALGLVEMG
jgi:hypothetical protein